MTRGVKTEFRSGRSQPAQHWNLDPPCPVVAYKLTRAGNDHEAKLMVLEETWREALGAISDESLEREGFETRADFRRYWKLREKKRFQPLHTVQVYRVRQWTDTDELEMGRRLIERLYAPFLPKT